jgi:cell division protein FtsL
MKRRSSLASLAGVPLLSVVLVVLLAVGGYYSLQVFQQQKQVCRSKQAELRQVEEQIRELQAQNALLRSQQARLQTPQGMEEVAREKLGMVRPGEIAYVVEPGPPARPASEELAPAPPAPPPPGMFQRVLDRLLF